MSRTLFDEVIGDVPPSTVNVKRIVTQQRRARAARRTFGVAAGSVALAVALTVGLGLARSPQPQDHATTAPSPSPTTHTLRFEASGAWETKWNWLSTELDQAMRRAAPDARWILQPAAGANLGADGDPPRFSGATNGLNTTWGLARGDLKGTLMVSFLEPLCMGANNKPYNCWADLPCPKETHCKRGTTPSGLRYVTGEHEGERAAQNTVLVALGNGLAMHISVDSGFMVKRDPKNGNDEYAYAVRPPLSLSEVVSIASDVSATIAP